MKGIKREFSVPRTPQQNGIAERKNMTLIEAPRTMLADLLLAIPFWAEEHEFEGRKPQSEVHVSPCSSAQTKKHDDKTKREAKGKSPVESLIRYRNLSAEFENFSDDSINEVNADDSLVPAVGQISTNTTNTFSAAGPSNVVVNPTHRKSLYVDTSQLPDDPNMLELEYITYSDDEDDVSAEDDFNNLETTITFSLIPTTRVHKDHPVTQIISDLSSATQTRSISRVAQYQGGLSQINNDDFHTCMFACFLSQEEPKRGIDYEEVFTPVARIEAISLFLAYASFMGFMVYQIDVKSAFLYGTIEKEVYVCQPSGFEDPDYPDKVYKVVKTLYGLHQAPRSCHDKYVDEILRKFGLIEEKLASTPIDTEKPLLKDPDVDKKRVIITEATIRDAFRLNDAEGIDCLPNEEIFTELARMGYEKPSTKLTFYKAFFSSQWKFLIHTILQCMSAKRTSWNEFSSSMASAVIYLSTGRNFNFSKAQVGNLSSHSTKYSSPAQIQKVFANMRRVGKGYSGVETSLFKGMIVAQQVGEGAAEVNVDDVPIVGVADEGAASVAGDVVPTAIAQALEITKLKQRVTKLERRNKLKVLKLRRLKKVRTSQRVDTSDDTVMDDVSKQERMIVDIDVDVDVTLKDIAKDVVVDVEIEESADVISMQDDEVEPAELQKVVEVVTTAKLITEVVTAASATITAAAPQLTTAATLTRTTAPTKSKDKGKGILVEEHKPLKKQAQIEQNEAYARELDAELNKNIDWDEVIDHVQRKEKEDNVVKRYQALKKKPQTEAQARKNMMIYLRNKTKEQMGEKDSKALKRLSESQEDKAAKKQKSDEEVKELKRHLQIVPNDEDDVYTEATLLAHKVPVVDYEIYTENNKPYYKIIRADGSQLFLSFLSLFRNFDREDLEVLWELVKESKGQKLETVRVLWSAHYHIYLYTYDLASREKISTYKVYSGTNAQQKSFCHNNIKNDLRKFKGKDIVDNDAQASNAATIALGMYKIDPVALARVSWSTKSSRSKSTDNKKNDRTQQISSRTQKKNKVEYHSRIIKSSLNKKNYVVEPFGNANVQHSKLNTNSKLMWVKCNSSMFDARHDLCFLEFVSDMNASSKSKYVKKAKNKEEWKPTGKVFTKIGYVWRPTGRTFTLIGNACSLTRIIATNKVPFREPIPPEVIAQESVVTKFYTRRPKVPKTNGSNSKPKIAKSMISNKTKPGTSWGSNTLVAPSSSSIDLRKPFSFLILRSFSSKEEVFLSILVKRGKYVCGDGV
nr:putative ribonuclease H-like domain-containing protein [Tanacetum cinerariifolium]